MVLKSKKKLQKITPMLCLTKEIDKGNNVVFRRLFLIAGMDSELLKGNTRHYISFAYQPWTYHVCDANSQTGWLTLTSLTKSVNFQTTAPPGLVIVGQETIVGTGCCMSEASEKLVNVLVTSLKAMFGKAKMTPFLMRQSALGLDGLRLKNP